MRKRIALGAVLAMVLATSAHAGTSVQIGVGFNVPPPRVVYQREPRWVMVPEGRVYIVDDDALDYDYFRYGGWYWIYDNDCWYRSRRYAGPFAGVRAAVVPEPIWRLGGRDAYRWRHRPAALPPGLARKDRSGGPPPGRERHEDRGHGHGRGHDHEGH